ncbi:MBL fold metallo-hydrolase [Corynebacterium frankenforstense]|uniref:MBL fold metallo-hydrolase n=1 Tax=Corynebacterium frankenforstense TaxID=1230998 RepID=UPI002550D560|nr:MBL fold metallo-hydrolase [Corynebacterium frankenforstense]MDK6260491.1 MBL fold metallo-hydrolase [Corynebacterium frankenforstense]
MEIQGFATGPYKTNCYLLIEDGRCVVVDAGMHAFAPVMDVLGKLDLELEAVVCTHGHIDHTRDAAQLANHFGVPVYIHPDDRFMLAGGDGVLPETARLFDAATMTQPEEVCPLDDAAVVTLVGHDFRVAHAPGHSPGSVLLIAEEVVLSGDVLFRGSIGRTDLPYSDPEAMKKTLAGPVAALDDALPVLPGHGPTTTVRAERATNPFAGPFMRAAGGAGGTGDEARHPESEAGGTGDEARRPRK